MAVAQYETTLILTPELSDTEVSKLIKGYTKFLKTSGGQVVHEESWGLRNLAYEINRKTTGFYFTVEFSAPTEVIATFELNLKRDESVLRFLTVRLDKYALDYNERKRKGLIGRDKEGVQLTEAEKPKRAPKVKEQEIAEEE